MRNVASPSGQTPVDPARRRRSRIVLVAFATLFLGPLAGSWIYHLSGGTWRPAPESHGILLESAPLLAGLSMEPIEGGKGEPVRFSGHWTLLYPGTPHCDSRCAEALYALRQVRIALGKDTNRLQRIYLVNDGQEPMGVDRGVHPDLLIVASSSTLQVLRELGGDHRFYLIDPAGRPVTAYGDDFEQRGLLEDVKHLLTFSNL